MPGYIIHMAEGETVLRLLKQKNFSFLPDPDWIRDFRIGLLLPDAVVSQQEKERTHFRDPSCRRRIISAPVLSSYLKQYPHNPADGLRCGYYTHLHLDSIYYSQFLNRYAVYRNEAGQEEEQRDAVVNVQLKDGRQIPKKLFFSDDFLYGDYTRLNNRLMEHYHLHLPDSRDIPDGCFCGIRFRSLDHVIAELKQFIVLSSQCTGSLQVLDEQELIAFLDQTAEEMCSLLSEQI